MLRHSSVDAFAIPVVKSENYVYGVDFTHDYDKFVLCFSEGRCSVHATSMMKRVEARVNSRGGRIINTYYNHGIQGYYYGELEDKELFVSEDIIVLPENRGIWSDGVCIEFSYPIVSSRRAYLYVDDKGCPVVYFEGFGNNIWIDKNWKNDKNDRSILVYKISRSELLRSML